MPQDTTKPYIRTRPEPDFDFLPEDRVRFFTDQTRWLRMTIGNDRTYLGVKVVRAFPYSDPDRYLGVLDARDNDKVIGLIAQPERLDPDSRRLADGALTEHYFIPVITRVNDMREEYGAFYFDVQTDRGRREFVAKGVRDATEELEDGSLLIPDVDGNRYRILDLERLDPKSRGLLEWLF
ncbi:MAG: DUF1854 domain-containing protein [Phycisphaerae bacterium]|nr:DUF1854 domain-containing protein [Phycisphaerae bacterium]